MLCLDLMCRSRGQRRAQASVHKFLCVTILLLKCIACLLVAKFIECILCLCKIQRKNIPMLLEPTEASMH